MLQCSGVSSASTGPLTSPLTGDSSDDEEYSLAFDDHRLLGSAAPTTLMSDLTPALRSTAESDTVPTDATPQLSSEYADSEEPSVIPVRIPAATPHVPSMVFAADGRALIVAASRADVRVYDAVTGVMLQAPADGTSTVRAVALDATGTILAIGSDDGRVRLWYVVGADIPPVAP